MSNARIVEAEAIACEAVDAAAGIVRGVKVLGPVSRNGRRYGAEAIRKAVGLYEGAKVNLDHRSNAKERRSYRDRFGALKQVRESGGSLFADLHFNPAHPLAAQFAWDATNAPERVGLSHDVTAEFRREGSTLVVEQIVAVHSVDVVADPATVNSLFESQETQDMDLKTLTLESLRSERGDLIEAILADAQSAKEAESLKARVADLEEAVRARDAKLAEHEAAAKAARLAEEIDAALAKAGLDPKDEKTVSKVFREALTAAAPESREALIADRVVIVKAASGGDRGPRSRVAEGAGGTGAASSGPALAERLKSFIS